MRWGLAVAVLGACAREKPPVDRDVLSWRAVIAPVDDFGGDPVWVDGGAPGLIWTEGRDPTRLMWSQRSEASFVEQTTPWSAAATLEGIDSFASGWPARPVACWGSQASWAIWAVRSQRDELPVLQVSMSMDGGFTWSLAEPLFQEGSEEGQGQAALVPASEDGPAVALWTQGREPLALMGRTLGASSWGPAEVLEPSVAAEGQLCAVRLGAADLLIAYRAPSSSGTGPVVWRQGSLQAGFGEAREIGSSGTKDVEGQGPAVARSAGRLALAWFEGSRDAGEVRVAFSSQLKQPEFSDLHRVDGGRPLGRVDLAALPGDRWLVAWLEDVPKQGPRWCVRLFDGGEWGAPGLLSGVEPDGQLRLSPAPDGAWAAWGDASGLQVAHLGPPQ